MIRDLLQWLLKNLGFEANFQAEIFPFIAQALFGILAAIAAWYLIHRGQQKSAEENRRIERARMLHDLDREYETIMATRCIILDQGDYRPPELYAAKDARSGFKAMNNNKVADDDKCLFELVLTRHVPWRALPDRGSDNGPNRYLYINGARHVLVADGYFTDTLTLHKVISWSKRVASGIHAQIIDTRDVCDMWRHILPWAKDNRFAFMAAFFGASTQVVLKKESEEKDWLSRTLVRAGRHVGASDETPSPFNQAIPRNWSGDVAPLYFLIRTVLEQAFANERVEILHYVGLDQRLLPELVIGGGNDAASGLDPIVEKVLFGAAH